MATNLKKVSIKTEKRKANAFVIMTTTRKYLNIIYGKQGHSLTRKTFLIILILLVVFMERPLLIWICSEDWNKTNITNISMDTVGLVAVVIFVVVLWLLITIVFVFMYLLHLFNLLPPITLLSTYCKHEDSCGCLFV